MQELLLIKLPTCNQCSSPGDSDEHRSTSECPMQECLGLLCLLSWRPWGAWMDVHKATNGQPGQVKQAALYSFTGMWLTSIYFGLCTFQKLNLHPLSIWGMLYIQCKSFSVDWISLISLFPLHAHFCAHVRLTLSLGQTHLSWCRQLNGGTPMPRAIFWNLSVKGKNFISCTASRAGQWNASTFNHCIS